MEDLQLAEELLRQRPLTEMVVHRTRQSLRQARAIVRLTRGALTSRVAEQEDERLGRAARLLSTARDARVVAHALATLEGRPTVGDKVHDLKPMLVARAEEFERDPALGQAAERALAQVQASRQRLAKHSLHGDWSLLRRELARSYRRARRAARAAQDGDSESFHRVRRRTKDLRNQLAALGPQRSKWANRLRRQLKDLVARLGENRDLWLLDRQLATARAPKAVSDAIARRRRWLERAARLMSFRAFRRKPGVARRKLIAA
jgi:CHAD domain-containing protein